MANRVCSHGSAASAADTAMTCRVLTIVWSRASATSSHTPAATPSAAGLSGNTITPRSTVVAAPITAAHANHAALDSPVAISADRHTSTAVTIRQNRIVSCAPINPNATYPGKRSADTPGAWIE